ncbi:type II and III secretion system protein family protein [Comamonas antarctica]|uniref:Pilus assembly protein N-terminal domain-containing protein n=1 Tax=Comamonas antarctica TaxID=2743470 RepID=A0A6N1X6I2_9BURK|nr:pilus assembly protein N-terminal domain-containing protein [Comamonas antarctica]QKV53455.1 pilus assembly protein N-terminal domain-containing protein [Comamonas antarctica]
MRTASPSPLTLPGLLACAALSGYPFSALAQQAPGAAPQPAEAIGALPVLDLTVGQQHLLQEPAAVARIAIGDPNLLDVKLLRDLAAGTARAAGTPKAAQLLLTPKAAGRTTLVIWPANGAPQTREVRVALPRLLLERRLGSVQQHAQALAEMRVTAPREALLLDRSEIQVASNTVQVDVQVVEFKKSALRRAGMNLASGGPNDHGFQFGVYTPGTSAGASGGGSSGSGSGSGSGNGMSAITSAMNLVLGFGKAFSGQGITAQLGFLEGNGLARVLAKPTLVAHTGQSASFLAGGEIPIPVPGRDGNVAIEYKEFGVKLQLTPTILSDVRIALKVAPEASDLDYTQGVTISGVSVPAVRTRRADTMVELADGESFIIGGLVNRATLSSVNKVPLLGDLPVLGNFFKNLNYSQEETELVIIVTPRLVQPLPANIRLEAMLPGALSEHQGAAQVWAPYVIGAPYANSALPGFSN